MSESVPEMVPVRYLVEVGAKWVTIEKVFGGWVACRGGQYVGEGGRWKYKDPFIFQTAEQAATAAVNAPRSWMDEDGRHLGGDDWWNGRW